MNTVSRMAVAQMVSVDDVDINLTGAAKLIRSAVTEGARLLALPENFAFMGRRETDKCHVAEHFGRGVIQEFLAEQALRHDIWLLAGSVPLRADDDMAEVPEKVCAASLLYSNDGRCAGRYDKIHLFDVEVPGRPGERYRESASHHAGDRTVLVKTTFGTLGLSVCYDLRFPELYRDLAARGAQILAVPSAFTEATGRAHWDTLLRARAIENQCYVLAPDQGGEHPGGRRTFGGSQIVDPWGEVLARVERGPGLAIADIDLNHLAEVRRQFPCLQHRRLPLEH